MSDEPTIPANVMLARLAALVSQDAQLLAIVRGLAREFLALTDPVPGVPEQPVPEAKPAEPPAVDAVPSLPPAAPAAPAPLAAPTPPAPPQHVALPSAGHRNTGFLVSAAHDRRDQPATDRGPLPT